MIGQMLAGSVDADFTHVSLVGINAFVLRLLPSVLFVKGGEGKSQSTNSSVTLL